MQTFEGHTPGLVEQLISEHNRCEAIRRQRDALLAAFRAKVSAEQDVIEFLHSTPEERTDGRFQSFKSKSSEAHAAWLAAIAACEQAGAA